MNVVAIPPMINPSNALGDSLKAHSIQRSKPDNPIIVAEQNSIAATF
jgi:hypothetical protein